MSRLPAIAALVADAQTRSDGVRRAFPGLLPARCPAWHPIPFFGPIDTAVALTMAMNPSADELRARSWPFELTADALAERLLGYFANAGVPPHPWFERSERPLLDLGLRYGAGLAHVDLVCRATRTIGKDERVAFLALADAEADLFFAALDLALNARVVVLSGSVTGARYAHEHVARHASKAGWRFGPKPERVRGGPFATRHELCRGSRRLAVLFTSSSVNKRGGAGPYERLVGEHREWVSFQLRR